jgi:hypothetical protein
MTVPGFTLREQACRKTAKSTVNLGENAYSIIAALASPGMEDRRPIRGDTPQCISKVNDRAFIYSVVSRTYDETNSKHESAAQTKT